MGIIELSDKFLRELQAYSKRCLEYFLQLNSNKTDSSTELKGESNDDSKIVEKSDAVEDHNFSRINGLLSLISTKYHVLMQNKLLMFCIVACSFVCIIQFLFFIIYWTDVVPRKTQKAIDGLDYDYLTAYLKEQCVPYEIFLDHCIQYQPFLFNL
ncbi:uncharacterized protein SKDI_07G0350 [Saccharomyces kudriavzevii IFO 1802]|uniref:Uncharacterized protein n=2 Tax=Saccharomyces kudriavzevii (strain ATCC MYA-4449 / AS 2.2408 / CBS 8840 / NBRC 1802 / NCYC 2889) TaxID=226230 RepID=A0AA35JI90_SACK1|nr:uncharacterized protein SKDI_07G0350 [Saccharomyces kudriavzevii IFO 1802]EJT41979.1 YGL230C-like protein [Saccharomyces kudriavzevii IFO 1802]CAI4061382.1 hypothetical protein SKDI_07G0350 [Saccharomyces kudriavzevii IFO 1802]